MKNKLIYFLIGVIILSGLYITRVKEIDKDTFNLLEEARRIDYKNIWEGYDLDKFPIDISYENIEFRYKDGKIISETKDVKFRALTAVSEEGMPVLKLVPKMDYRNLLELVKTSSGKSIEEGYISAIHHEGFHAFQISKGLLDGDIEDGNEIYKKFDDLLSIIDSDNKYKEIWLKEYNSLVDYLETGDSRIWKENYNKRLKYLKEKLGKDYDDYIYMEEKYELAEGTAKYMEDKVLEKLRNKEKEIKKEDFYIDGNYKMYLSGQVKSLILDKENGDSWKDIDFDSSVTLTNLLAKDNI